MTLVFTALLIIKGGLLSSTYFKETLGAAFSGPLEALTYDLLRAKEAVAKCIWHLYRFRTWLLHPCLYIFNSVVVG